MRSLSFKVYVLALCVVPFIVSQSFGSETKNVKEEVLKVGQILPNAVLSQYGKPDLHLSNLKGRIKIISVVPQLNTPTCDEQTHRFSETNGGIDKYLDILTISTNSAEGQFKFAKKANIGNLIFLSDSPNYDFGEKTGLLRGSFNYLKRTVLVADKNNVIRYVDFVPGGGLPNIERALNEAKKILKDTKS